MMKNRTLEALEKEDDQRLIKQGQEEIPKGLQQAIKETKDAIKKAFDRPEKKRIAKVRMIVSA